VLPAELCLDDPVEPKERGLKLKERGLKLKERGLIERFSEDLWLVLSSFDPKIASSRQKINLRRHLGLLMVDKLALSLLAWLFIDWRGLSSGDSDPALLISLTISSRYLKSSSSPLLLEPSVDKGS
jgi:hypothetical protein